MSESPTQLQSECESVVRLHVCWERWGTPKSFYTGNYYLDDGIAGASTITLTGDVTLSGAVVAIAPNKKILIPQGKTLTIDGSHLVSCRPDTMWQGIVISGTGSCGKLVIVDHSLIEDAIMAVSLNMSFSSGTPTGVLTVNNATFNRNWEGINLQSFIDSSGGAFPFSISNAIFTSRDFTGYYDGASTYPFVWPNNTAELKGAYTPASGSIVQPPYNIDNPTGKPTATGYSAYTKVPCKEVSMGDAYAGIYAFSMGIITTTVYPGLYIEGNLGTNYVDSACMFDNLNYGLLDSLANMSVTGSIFMYCHPRTGALTLGGRGIRVTGNQSKYQLSVNLPTATDGDGHKNVFYDCKTAVDVINMHAVDGNYNEIYSDHAGGTDTLNGNTGYKIQYNASATATYNVNVNYNYVNNIYNGIVFTSTSDAPTANINMNNNQFISNNLDWGSASGKQGIYAVNGGSSGTGATGYINADSNETYRYAGGIYMSGFKRKIAQSNGNNIYLGAVANVTTYGIAHIQCVSDSIMGNWVEAYSPGRSPLAAAIHSENNNPSTVRCNHVLHINKGFEFITSGTLQSYWNHNKMEDNTYGYFLNGAIGQQGDTTNPIGNDWLGNTWTIAGPYMTFNAGTALNSAIALQLYVSDNAGTHTYDPWANQSGAAGLTHAYGGLFCTGSPCYSYGLHHAIMDSSSCAPMNAYFPLYRLYEPTAQKDTADVVDTTGMPDDLRMTHVNTDAGRKWIAQMALWQTLQHDSSLVDSSAILQEFARLADNSRYGWLTAIEHALANDNISTAQSLLSSSIDALVNTTYDSATNVNMNDGTNADYVVQNYLDYYNLYIKYRADTMSGDDSTAVQALASLCPLTDGWVVYNARALYSSLYEDYHMWDANCEAADTTTGRHTQGSNHAITAPVNDPDLSRQGYRLYPNPNDGNITLLQSQKDIRPIEAEILNVQGVCIDKTELHFTNQQAQLNLGNATGGIYILKLKDSSGNTFNLKFVIR